MAVKNIIHDQLFLMQKSTLANAKDMQVAVDLRDTLLAKCKNLLWQTQKICKWQLIYVIRY